MKKPKRLLSKRARNPLISRVEESESSPILSQSMPSYSGVDRINMSASTIDTTLSSIMNNNNTTKSDKLNAKLTGQHFIKIKDSEQMVCKISCFLLFPIFPNFLPIFDLKFLQF